VPVVVLPAAALPDVPEVELPPVALPAAPELDPETEAGELVAEHPVPPVARRPRRAKARSSGERVAPRVRAGRVIGTVSLSFQPPMKGACAIVIAVELKGTSLAHRGAGRGSP